MQVRVLTPITDDGAAVLINFESRAEFEMMRMLMARNRMVPPIVVKEAGDWAKRHGITEALLGNTMGYIHQQMAETPIQQPEEN